MSSISRSYADPPWQIRWIFFDAVGTLMHVRGSVGEIYGRQAAAFGFEPASSPSSYIVIETAFRKTFKEITLRYPQKLTVDGPKREREWWRQVVKGTFERIAPFPRLDQCFEQIYEVFRTTEAWELERDAQESLSLLSADRNLGIISNFDSRLEDVLTDLGIRPFFQQLTIPGLAGAAKPDPAIFRYAMTQVGADSGECLYVGDEVEDDYAAPQAAGMRALLYDPRNRQRGLPGADQIKSLGEVRQFLV